MNDLRGQSYSPVRVEGTQQKTKYRWLISCPKCKEPINSITCLECPKRPKCRTWRIECPWDGSKVTGLDCAKCPDFSKCNEWSASLAVGLQTENRSFDGTPRKGVQTILVEHVQRSLHLKRAQGTKGVIEKEKRLAVQKRKSRSRFTFEVRA
jgi:hypothetical protein